MKSAPRFPLVRERMRAENLAGAVALTLDAAQRSLLVVAQTQSAATAVCRSLQQAHPRTDAARNAYRVLQFAAQAAASAEHAARAALASTGVALA